MDAGGAANASEVEAQGAQAHIPGSMDRTRDDGIVHGAPIQRVRVADDEPPPRALGQGQAALQTRPTGDLDVDLTLHDRLRLSETPFPADSTCAIPTLGARRGIFKAA